MGEYNLDEAYAKHLANLTALARTLHDSVHVVRVEAQSIAENLHNLNQASDAGDDADFPFEDFRDASAALADAQRRIREVERIVRSYRRDLADVESQVPGQVEPEPAAPVRIDSLFGQIKSEEITVAHPDWNNGKPVLLTELHDRFDGRVDVTYGVPETRDYLSVTVAADTLVTLYGGAE